MPSVSPTPERMVVIEPGRPETDYWRDLWQHRELFAMLAWRDIMVRYKQTAIGIAWAGLRPFLTMIVFTILFGGLAKLPSDGHVPYPIMVFGGMLPWFLFSSILQDASMSLVTNAPLISKVYFPRLIVPATSVGVALIDMAVNFVILAGVMLWYGFAPGWQIVFLPAFILLALLASFGPALWIAALNVKFRDFRYVMPFLIQFGLYVSPVGFSSSVIPEKWRLLYSLNPVVGVIDGFRWCLSGGASQLYIPGLVANFVVVLVLAYFGLRYFRRTERAFADIL